MLDSKSVQDDVVCTPAPVIQRPSPPSSTILHPPTEIELIQRKVSPQSRDASGIAIEKLEAEAEANGPIRGKLRTFAILSALFMALFVAALDATIVSTAIPTIASHFNSAAGYTWIGSAYLLGMASASPIFAKTSDIWGRKPVLLSAVGVFICSSIICATSYSMGMLIAGRALQGSAGGGLIVLVNICISDIFSMRTRGLFLGLLEFVWALAGGIGPVLGGMFTQLLSWRWVWWINLPLAGVTFLVLLIWLDVHNPRTNVIDGIKAVDWLGTITILGLTLMLLMGLDFGGETFPWDSPKVICLIVFGLVMGIFFIFSESKVAKYPLMPLKMMKHRSNLAALIICFTHGFVFISAEYYLPLYFQAVHSMSPLRSGVMLLPTILPTAIVGIIAGVVIHRTGRYVELIYAGNIFLTLGFGLFIALNAQTPLWESTIFQVIAGFGAGLLFEPPLIALQALVRQGDVAAATATFGFIRNMATALSIVVGGVVFQNSMELRVSRLEASGLPRDITDALSGSTAAANVMLVSIIEDSGRQRLVKEAFSWSLRNMWILVTAVAALGIVASFFVGEHVLLWEHVETQTGLEAMRKEKESERDDQGAARCH